MVSFFIVLLCFLFSFVLHIAAHRIIRLRSIAAYSAGLVSLYMVGRLGYIALPWLSGFLYILLSATAVLFYLAISLGTEVPSSIILKSFKRKKRQTFEDITALFTDRGLIFNRLDDLVLSKLVTRNGRTLTLTGRGRMVWYVMNVYRRVFHRRPTE